MSLVGIWNEQDWGGGLTVRCSVFVVYCLLLSYIVSLLLFVVLFSSFDTAAM